MAYTYLTTEELSARIKFDPRTIRNQLKRIPVLLEGLHYIRPFGDASCCSFGSRSKRRCSSTAPRSNLSKARVARWRLFSVSTNGCISILPSRANVVGNGPACRIVSKIVASSSSIVSGWRLQITLGSLISARRFQ